MSSHVYWRLRSTSSQGPATQFSLRELIWRDTLLGAQKATGGTPLASSEFGFAPKANAYDGDTTGSLWFSSGSVPQYIGYQFSAPIEIAQIVIYCEQAQTASLAFTIDYSDDGSSWTTAYTGTGADVASWTTNEVRTITTGLTGSGGAGAAARPVVMVIT